MNTHDIELPPLPTWAELDNKYKDGQALTALEQLILFEGYEADFHKHLRPALIEVIRAAIEADRKRQVRPLLKGKLMSIKKKIPYNRIEHQQGLVDFLQAWDMDDLPNGAWQAYLEGGAETYSDEFLMWLKDQDRQYNSPYSHRQWEYI